MPTTQELIQLTDQCVLCGLCLPHCPTYQVSQNEAESPRGRISLVKAYASGQLEPDRTLQAHLASCTNCLKCQSVCPAKVSFELIIDGARSLQSASKPISIRSLQALSAQLMTHGWGHKLLRFAACLLRLLPNAFRTSLASATRWLSLLNKIRPTKLHHIGRYKPFKPEQETQLNRLGVFPGCSGELFDQTTLASIQGLLSAFGYHPVLPDQTLCCGALDQHNGHLTKAKRRLQQSVDYFNPQTEINAQLTWLTFASGCSRQLQQYAQTVETVDIMTWLNQTDHLDDARWRGTQQRVLVHTPCSINSSDRQAMMTLLQQIPNCHVEYFNDGLNCCGAGGMQLLTPQAVNLALLDSKCAYVQDTKPDVIISPNIGCALHLQTGLEQAGLAVEVIHPVTFIFRQLVIG